HRWSTIAGEGGVRPVVLKRRIVPTGEPCNTETVPHGSVGGRGKRRVSDLACGLPNLLRRFCLRQQVSVSVRHSVYLKNGGKGLCHENNDVLLPARRLVGAQLWGRSGR